MVTTSRLSPAQRCSSSMSESSTIVGEPVLTADGEQVLFSSGRGGGAMHVWKIDRDGGQPVQLTNGPGETLADLDPRNRWFIYRSLGPEGGLWLQSLAPGDSARHIVPEGDVINAMFSRSGRSIGYPYFEAQGNRFEVRIALAPIDDEGKIGPPTSRLDLPEGHRREARWGPTDDEVVYLITRDGVSNLWISRLKEGSLTPVTRFESGFITSFEYSPDFKQLAIGRGEVLGDVVLLADFR